MDIVESVFSFIEFLGKVDFSIVFSVFGVGLLLFWIVVIGWVWSDALERYRSKGAALMIVILLITINIFGLVIYFIIRPRYTLDEEYWENLEKRFLKYEAQGLGDCPHCGEEVQPSFIFCRNCGRRLRVKCKECEMYLEPDWKVCPFCGTNQRKKKETIKTSPVNNIDTLPNQKILQWGRKIDVFFKDVKKRYLDMTNKIKKTGKKK